jgi:hypothetical protein
MINTVLKYQSIILEKLIDRIAQDTNLNAKELKKKYLNDFKYYKKRSSKRKGVINAYAAFLADKKIDNKLREENPEASFGELSKLKGPLWKQLGGDEKARYKQIAKEKTELNQKNKKI